MNVCVVHLSSRDPLTSADIWRITLSSQTAPSRLAPSFLSAADVVYLTWHASSHPRITLTSLGRCADVATGGRWLTQSTCVLLFVLRRMRRLTEASCLHRCRHICWCQLTGLHHPSLHVAACQRHSCRKTSAAPKALAVWERRKGHRVTCRLIRQPAFFAVIVARPKVMSVKCLCSCAAGLT